MIHKYENQKHYGDGDFCGRCAVGVNLDAEYFCVSSGNRQII